MLDDLLDYLRAPDIEEDVFIRLLSASWRGEDLSLEVAIFASHAVESHSNWRIECSEVVDYGLAEAHGDVAFHDVGHVVARQHSDSTRSLMFRACPSSIPDCVGRLWLAHERVAGHWIPFDRYRNTRMSFDGLLRAGSGLLASGPAFLMEAYAEAIAGTGAGEYLTEERPSRFGEGRRFGTFLLGRAFVVAPAFDARRIAQGAG